MYHAYLLELPLDVGITGKQMNALLVKAGMDEAYFTVTIEAEHSWAFGIIAQNAADAVYDLDGKAFADVLRPFLEDEEKLKPFYTQDGSFVFDVGAVRVHLYRTLPVPVAYDGDLLSLEEAELRYGFYGCVDAQNNPHDYILLNLPRVIQHDPVNPSNVGKYASYGVPITDDEKPIPCGPTVMLVWASESGFEDGDNPTIVDLAPYACKKADDGGYCRVWARIGASMRVPKEELTEAVLADKGTKLVKMVRSAFVKNLFQLDGDSYIPECVVEQVDKKYNLGIREYCDLGFDL